jgi:glycosyltransferase involved in cell wall biosynthesis
VIYHLSIEILLMKEIIFINSHPIQYFAPMYKYLNEHGVKTKAWYCSDESIKGGMDKQFGVDVKWDIPLLEGYESHFFKNQSWKPSHFNGFFGLINWGMVRELSRTTKSVIIVHGWHYFSLLYILLFGNKKGHVICLRCDVPLNQERRKKGVKQNFKNLFLKKILFPRIQYFLYVGNQNKLFYKSLGVGEDRLISCPYAVDNDRFRRDNISFGVVKNSIKEQLNIPKNDKIILFTAKYIDKKKPLDLLKAFHNLNMKDVWLLMVGEGELRGEMEAYITQNEMEKVVLTGFVNQTKISEYYAISDVFAMTSFVGENWGLSVNEAMNFNLPLVISDFTGCADDLVEDGVNGYIFKTGDINQLTEKLKMALCGEALSWNRSSQDIIDNYSFNTILKNLQPLLN